MADRGAEQFGERQPGAERVGGLQRQDPTRDRARHRQGGERPARRNRLEPGLGIELRLRPAAGDAGRHQGTHPARRLAQEPEAVAAELVHVRIDHRDRSRHGDHGLDGVAALGQDRAAGLCRSRVGRSDHAATVAGGV